MSQGNHFSTQRTVCRTFTSIRKTVLPRQKVVLTERHSDCTRGNYSNGNSNTTGGVINRRQWHPRRDIYRLQSSAPPAGVGLWTFVVGNQYWRILNLLWNQRLLGCRSSIDVLSEVLHCCTLEYDVYVEVANDLVVSGAQTHFRYTCRIRMLSRTHAPKLMKVTNSGKTSTRLTMACPKRRWG